MKDWAEPALYLALIFVSATLFGWGLRGWFFG